MAARDDDPFRHHPELRGLIRDFEASPLRELDLDELDRQVVTNGGPADWRYTDAQRRESRARVLDRRWDEDLWVFAYGSLMWDPGFRFTEVRACTVSGYERRFCLQTQLGRGTPDQPGLMAALDVGVSCAGLAFRIPREHLDEETWVLWRRELLMPAYVPAFVSTETAHGTVEALTFLMDRSIPAYVPDLTDGQIARQMAVSCGFLGTNLEYAENLADNLAAVGLADPYVEQLRDRARSIARRG